MLEERAKGERNAWLDPDPQRDAKQLTAFAVHFKDAWQQNGNKMKNHSIHYERAILCNVRRLHVTAKETHLHESTEIPNTLI